MNELMTGASVKSRRRMRLPEWRNRSGRSAKRLEAPCDCEYIRRKDDALRAGGFELLRFHIGPEV
jgi:hypothetical protein